MKRVVDYNVRIRVNSDGSGLALDGVKMGLNPFDEVALEEALQVKERGEAEEVVVVCIGVADAQQQLRTALAMGADRAADAGGAVGPSAGHLRIADHDQWRDGHEDAEVPLSSKWRTMADRRLVPGSAGDREVDWMSVTPTVPGRHTTFLRS